MESPIRLSVHLTLFTAATVIGSLLSACSPKPPENTFAPVLGMIPDQIVPVGYGFSALALTDYLENRPVGTEWSVTDQEILTVIIEDGVAQVQAPSDWVGQENLQFHACDRWNRCDSSEVNYIRFDEDDLLIGFFGIDGFIIAHQGQQILIDALVAEDRVVDSLITETLLAGQPPLQNIDLMLITHDHQDHFEADSVLQFLRTHADTWVLSTPQVVSSLSALIGGDDPLQERIATIEFTDEEETTQTINHVEVTVFDLPHPGSSTLQNYGFMLHLGELNILHTGDLDYNFNSMDEYPYSGYPIDYAFLPTMMVNDLTYAPLQEWLGDGTLIPMHYSTTGSYAAVSAIELQEIREQFPDGIYYTHELQYWLGP